MHVLLGNVNSWAQIILCHENSCKTVKLCTYVHLVWAFQGRSRLGGAIHSTWIDAYGAHEPIHVQEAEKESHGAGTAWPKPSISRFLGYSGPDGACKWVIWGWESGSGSGALHSRPHLRWSAKSRHVGGGENHLLLCSFWLPFQSMRSMQSDQPEVHSRRSSCMRVSRNRF